MTRNVGRSDRMLRMLVIGPVLVVAALALGVASAVGGLLLVAAIAMFATGAVGFCPLYRLLGISTARRRVGAQ